MGPHMESEGGEHVEQKYCPLRLCAKKYCRIVIESWTSARVACRRAKRRDVRVSRPWGILDGGFGVRVVAIVCALCCAR